jgi:hypothetical protein
MASHTAKLATKLTTFEVPKRLLSNPQQLPYFLPAPRQTPIQDYRLTVVLIEAVGVVR